LIWVDYRGYKVPFAGVIVNIFFALPLSAGTRIINEIETSEVFCNVAYLTEGKL